MLLRTISLLLAMTASAAVAPATDLPRSVERGGGGKVYLTTQEALLLAFPEAEVKRVVRYLDAAQKKRVGKLAGSKQVSEMVVAYEGRSKTDGSLLGTAYFDTHKVRTKCETLMVIVAPDQTVERIEVLAFSEPEDYLPQTRWLAQFQGKKLSGKLQVKGDIRGITGATLTARAATRAVRLILARHQITTESTAS